MKKFLSILMILAICLTLGACSYESEPKKETSTETSSQETVKDDVFKLNDVAVFEDLKFSATEIKETAGESFFEADEGNIFVGVKFAVENISKEEQNISSILLFEAYADDVKCDYSFTATAAFDGGTLDGSIAPGKKMVGWYAVEIPKNWKTLELEVQGSWLSNNSATFVFEK